MVHETTRFFTEESPRRNTSPAQKYAEFVQWCAEHKLTRRNITYLSTTITSGGFKHVVDRSQSGWIGTVVAGNNAVSSAFRDALIEEGLAKPDSVLVFAPDIGQCQYAEGESWGESDYLLFWFAIIAGVPPKFVEKIGPDFRMKYPISHTLNDHSLQHDQRQPSYDDFIAHFLAALRYGNPKVEPAREVIRLLDPESSLGAYAEKMVAQACNVPVATVRIDNLGHPCFDSVRERLQILIDAGVPIQSITTALTGRALVLESET